MTIEPTQSQFERLCAAAEIAAEPVVMVNLLRFKPRADGIDEQDGISGTEAYGRYGAAVAPFLERVGARVLFAAEPQESVIGPEHGEWDLVLAVEYPSRSAFIAMTTDPEYIAVHAHRAAALADSRLIACKPMSV